MMTLTIAFYVVAFMVAIFGLVSAMVGLLKILDAGLRYLTPYPDRAPNSLSTPHGVNLTSGLSL